MGKWLTGYVTGGVEESAEACRRRKIDLLSRR
jgi:hypothetical protein